MNTDSNGLKHEAGLREDLKITLWRVLAALLVGLFLDLVFLYLFFNITPRIAESVGEFIGRVLGLGFEGAPVELLIIGGIAVAFFFACLMGDPSKTGTAASPGWGDESVISVSPR